MSSRPASTARIGRYAPVNSHRQSQFPYVLGRDFSGCGRRRRRRRAGPSHRRCRIRRSCSSAGTAPTPRRLRSKPPSWRRNRTRMSHAQAAAMALTGLTALSAVEDTLKLQAGETILIQGGAGGVASFAIQLAKHIGARVITTASAANHDYLRSLGADEIIDYNAKDFTEVMAGCDAVFDTVGGDVAQRSFAVLRPGGRAAFIASGPQAPTTRSRRRASSAAAGRTGPPASRARRRAFHGGSRARSRDHALSPVRGGSRPQGERVAPLQGQAGLPGSLSPSMNVASIVDTAKSSRALLVLLGLMVASLAGLLLLPPIPQDQSYHQFADQRALLGVPNFWNVVSNLPFIVIGAAGLRRFHGNARTFVLFAGMLLTGIGSSYYHWNPNDATLLWDRLPMTLCFMAILALAIEERVDARIGAMLLWPLLAIGCSACWCGAGPTISGCMRGCSFFHASRCRCCSCCIRRDTPAPPTGSIAAGTLRPRQADGVLRPCDLFRRRAPERAHDQAPCRISRLLRDLEVLPNSPADRVALSARRDASRLR